jgi:A/G-specific adenine glycosylase
MNWLSDALLQWFTGNGRDYPWRHTTDPYEILVAEKLLQQTSVRPDLVTAYTIILAKYPSPANLAGAQVADIERIIQKLGLLYRARDLILMAQDVCEKFGGQIPKTLPELLSIFGVGDYSARAVLSFAYGLDYAVVDVNVARIIYRVNKLEEKLPANPARSRKLYSIVGDLLPEGCSREFNWAMIDLGALICSAKQPSCEKCPLNHRCITWRIK